MNAQEIVPSPVAMGVAGLDDVLYGGLPPFRQYLVEGMPGTGKPLLQCNSFSKEGTAGRNAIYITLSETNDELLDVARSHRW